MAARTTKQQLCVVKLGFQSFLLPQAQAVKFLDLASNALAAEYEYSDTRRMQYRIGDPPEVELTTVRADQLIMPESAMKPAKPATARGSRKALGQDRPALTWEQ